MNYEETKTYLTRYIKARIPIITINTLEKDRIIRMLNEPMTIDTIKLINCSVSATCTCSLPTQLPKGAKRSYLFSVFSAVALNLRMPSISWSSDKLGIFLNTLSNSVSSSFEKFILPIAPPSLLNKPLISVLFAK